MSDEDDPKDHHQKGGLARAAALTDERKKEIAKAAALARWGSRATHRGNFNEEFGIDVDCYVLNDTARTAVISQRGMAAALGLDATSGRALPRFLKGEKIAPYVGDELRQKFQNPLRFQWSDPVVKQPPSLVYGYDVTMLVDVCKAIIRAHDEGKLLRRQEHIAKSAQVIINASAKAGIKGLVYALAGYDATRQETIEAFKFYVREEAREYEKEFPDQLYEEWYRLYELPRPEKNRPWKFKHLTVEQVYKPLGRSAGKVYALTQQERASTKERWKKLHQFLSEIGVKALRTHLGQLLGVARIAPDRDTYERHVRQLFGEQPDLPFPEP